MNPDPTPDVAPGENEPRRRTPARSLFSLLLIALACILAPLSVVSTWASTQISDTDRYVETVSPLARDPEIQSAVANRVTTAVVEAIDAETLAGDLLTALADQPNVPDRLSALLPGLAQPIASGVESFVGEQARNLVTSDRFPVIWEELNRTAHGQVVVLLEGRQGGALSAQDSQVTLNLAPVIEEVKSRLVARGFTLAERIPAVDRSFVLVESDQVRKIQGLYRLLSVVGVWLPFVALALLVGGVLLARDRRRALLRGSLGVVAAMLLLAIGLALGRWFYLQALPADASLPAAQSVFDTVVRFLRDGLRVAALAFALVALVAFLAGPGRVATRARATVGAGVGRVGDRAQGAGWTPGPVSGWVAGHAGAVRAAIGIAAAAVVVVWPQPTLAVIAWTAVVALVVLLIAELLIRAGRGAAAPAGG